MPSSGGSQLTSSSDDTPRLSESSRCSCATTPLPANVSARNPVLALYQSGPQAEALNVYRETRSLLVDELGIDPKPSPVGSCEQTCLRQEPDLATQSEATSQAASSGS